MTKEPESHKKLREKEADTDDIEIEPEDDINHEPFDPTKIRVDTRIMTIDLVIKRIKYDEINLAPNFQRQANIWTPKAQSRLIESILIRIPLPAFYLDATKDDQWVVIDGLQRLSALKKFVVDQNLKLIDLEFLKELEGKTYDELSRNYQRRIDEAELNIYLIAKGTPPKVKFNIFRRINTGGLPLSPQELRHAINPGKATPFLRRLAEYQEFLKLTKLSEKRKKRIEDHEFVLGFVAFCLTDYSQYSDNEGRDVFLDNAMEKINKLTEEEENALENYFLLSMSRAEKIFGEEAFRKPSKPNHKRYPLNRSLFEAWSVELSKLNPKQAEKLIQNKEYLKDRFLYYFENDKEFEKSISQAANKVRKRFDTIGKIIQESL